MAVMPAPVRLWPGRRVRRAVQGLPDGVRVGAGVALAIGGLALTTRPLTSLAALAVCVALGCLAVGALDLLRRDDAPVRRLTGAAWVVLGVAIVVWPGQSVGWIGLALSAALVVTGALRLTQVRDGSWDVRVSRGALGLAEIALGVTALAWPDVTLVVVAALFGVRLVVLGVALVLDVVARRSLRRRQSPPSGWRRGGRLVWSGTALVLSVAVLVASALIRAPVRVDDFYSATSSHDGARSDEPGTLLRWKRFAREVPRGAEGWRILYRTSDAAGRPTLASGLVVLPRAPGTHPVVAWAHSTPGFARQCAPSLLEKPFSSGGFPDVMADVVERGWAVVATDYAGLGTDGTQPYLIGSGEAYSVLDSVRAARQLVERAGRRAGGQLSDRTVVWGHSQGGGAALWTSQLQPRYAPDVPISGTAALAPASDLVSLVRTMRSAPAGAVLSSYVVTAYARAYPDVNVSEVLRTTARPLVSRIATRCPSEPRSLASVLTALSVQEQDVLAEDPGTGPLGRRLRENTPTDPGTSPLLLAQGDADPLVRPDAQAAYVARLRAGGHRVDYRTYPGRDHGSLVERGSALLPELLRWTAARFRG